MMLQYLLILSARRGNDYLIRRDNERALGGSRALIIAELHGKRKILVKRKVTHKRYSELRREMGNITDAVLVGTFKLLIADGIVSRKSYDEIPACRCSCAASQIRNDFTPFCLRITAFRQFSQWFPPHSPDAPRRD